MSNENQATSSLRTMPNINAIIKAMGAQRRRRSQTARTYLAECDDDLVILDRADKVRGLIELIEMGIAHDGKDSEVLAEIGQHYWQDKPELRQKLIDNLRSIADAVERAA